ncbi:MAG: GNAT family N-acetyltransferase [Acidimicrobiales bacterium]
MVSLRYQNLTSEWIEGAAHCERVAFPTAEPGDLLGAEDFAAYLDVFPEGVFVVIDDDTLDGPSVVGVGAGILVNFDFDHIEHTIWEVAGEHQCGNHDPNGDWYYGTDITVLPEYRGHGIGRRLYEHRKDVVRRLGRRGIIAGGHLPGFADVKHMMTAEEYVADVVAGRRSDATLSFQLSNGFEVAGVIQNYFADPAIDNKASLIVWRVDESVA